MREPGGPIEAPDLSRSEGLHHIRLALKAESHVVLTTHVNADGDGAGSEAATAHYLARLGVRATIVNPTPFPDAYRFLLDRIEAWTPADEGGRRALEEAGLVLVLDTAERSRLGAMLDPLAGKKVAVLDHHPPGPAPLGDPALLDPSACATGELVYDLITADGGEVTRIEAEGLYVAIVTDTGSFRFSNTTPRTHRIAAVLLAAGVDPEAMYARLYGRVTPARVELLRRALGALRTDPELPVSWIALTPEDFRASGAGWEDLEGLVDHARQLAGVQVALLLRGLPDGRTKVSLRSNGPLDVAEIARRFGGGGHEKAAGLLTDAPIEETLQALLAELRAVLPPRGSC
ncbi:MAG: bifunctional oligoribonuclease/PAP phosphatase NrnA [Gemmatimonadota bacterium]